jgi:hypothetical protein
MFFTQKHVGLGAGEDQRNLCVMMVYCDEVQEVHRSFTRVYLSGIIGVGEDLRKDV